MDAAAIAFVIIALALGTLIGWLAGSRGSAGGKEVAENLRLQLNAVTDERDANRQAAHELAVLKAAQEERERSFQQQIEAVREAKESLSAQFHEIGVRAAQAHAGAVHQVVRGIAERLVDVTFDLGVQCNHLANGHEILPLLRLAEAKPALVSTAMTNALERVQHQA